MASNQMYDLALARLDALGKIEAAATPAPWIHDMEDGQPSEWVILDDENGIAEALDGPHDAAFIAIIRNVSPALLSLLRALMMERRVTCPKCGGKGTIRVMHGMSFDTDSAAERTDCWHTKPCDCRRDADAAIADFSRR